MHESAKAGIFLKNLFHFKTNWTYFFVIWIFFKVKWLDRTNDEIYKRSFIPPWYRFGYESGSINGERPGEVTICIIELFKKIRVIYIFKNFIFQIFF